MLTKQQKEHSLPDYLKNLGNTRTYFNNGDYSYLQGLSVRPTKRRRFVAQESCSTDSDAFCQAHLHDEIIDISPGIFWSKISVVIPSVALIICVSAVLLLGKLSAIWTSRQSNSTKSCRKRRRQKARKETSILVDIDTGSVEVTHKSFKGTIANPSLDVQLTSSEESAGEEITLECDDNSNIRHMDSNKINRTVNTLETDDESKTGNEIVMHHSRDCIQLSNNSCVSPRLANGQIPNIQIEQLAQRWESKGLDRQKSLELAAHFEMNMLFFRELQHYLSIAASNIMKRFVWMHFNNLKQMKQQHRDQMTAPYMEEMKRHRQHMTYMLLNTRFLTRCIILALASRFYFMHGNTLLWNWDHIPPFNNVLSHIFSFMCPECSTELSKLALASSSYGLVFLSNFMYSGVESISCTAICSMKIVWYAALLLFCHHYISKSLSCGTVVLLIVDWKSIFQLGIVVTVMNLTLTMLMCKHVDGKGETMETREVPKYYERCTLSSEVLAHLISILVGFFFSHNNSSKLV